MIEAKIVQVDTANDLALLKADGTFSPLPIAASRTAHLPSEGRGRRTGGGACEGLLSRRRREESLT